VIGFYYGFDGESISQERWSELYMGERHVALTRIGDVEVSTVWLGLDHSFGMHGPPIIYETMVFGGKLDETMDRYASWDAALAGHDQLAAAVRDAEASELPPPAHPQTR
jgi:hypothetical protein